MKVEVSRRCKEKTGYRKVIGRIIDFAENEIMELYPDLDREERIKKAHDDPFFTAAKELRGLTFEEKDVLYNGYNSYKKLFHSH